jgi:hypothetical protein
MGRNTEAGVPGAMASGAGRGGASRRAGGGIRSTFGSSSRFCPGAGTITIGWGEAMIEGERERNVIRFRE